MEGLLKSRPPAPPEASSGRKAPDVLAGCLLAAGTVLLLFLFRAAEQTGDSLDYAHSIQTGRDLFHPHHLLFNAIVRLIFLFISSVFPGQDAIFAAQIHNILWAAVAVGALYLIIRRLLNSVFWGILAATALLVSASFWQYATQTEVYVPAMGCLALIAVLTFRPEPSANKSPPVLALSLLFALSIFYHQTNIFFGLPLGYLLIAVYGRIGRKQFARIAFFSGAIVLSAYMIAFAASTGSLSLRGFIHFCLAYIYHPNPDWGNIGNVSCRGVGLLLLSQARSFVFFAKSWNIPALILSAALLSFLSVWNAIRIIKRGPHYRLRCMILIWLCVEFLFSLWWSPWEKEMFIITLFPIVILIFVTLGDFTGKIRSRAGLRSGRAAAVLVICVAVLTASVNFKKVILPSLQSKGEAYREASLLMAHTPPESVILTDWEIQQSLRYYYHKESALEEAVALLCFYQRLPLPPDYVLPPEKTLVISKTNLLPETDVIKKFDGYRNPAEWLRFIGWLFQFESDARREVISCRSFEILVSGQGYICLSAQRMNVEGLRDLFERLDRAISARFGDTASHFLGWHEKNLEFLQR
ncbi:MAG: DUF2723 domain-containing protein [Candidatus Aminicenantales bacterium]